MPSCLVLHLPACWPPASAAMLAVVGLAPHLPACWLLPHLPACWLRRRCTSSSRPVGFERILASSFGPVGIPLFQTARRPLVRGCLTLVMAQTQAVLSSASTPALLARLALPWVASVASAISLSRRPSWCSWYPWLIAASVASATKLAVHQRRWLGAVPAATPSRRPPRAIRIGHLGAAGIPG